jgi:NitT/TauT family transport system ATP-binding protein
MTFPFSHHNYQLRFWMAAGGTDPDEDVRLVVLPPPFMVESLASGHVDGFCVGAPWNSVAVDSDVGRILHFGCEIMANVSEKVLAVRQRWAEDNRGTLSAVVRALARAGKFVDDRNNHSTVAEVVARRIDVAPELVVRTLSGNLKVAPGDAISRSDRYIVVGRESTSCPDPIQAAWAYAQIVRWAQAPLSEDLRAAAENVFRADLYDAALGRKVEMRVPAARDRIGAFAGPGFDANDIAGYLDAWRTRREHRPRLSVVR